jgi:hypothetical protein
MPQDEASEPRRTSAASLGARHAVGLTFAHLITAAEVLAVVWSLTGQTFGDTKALLTQTNIVTLAVVVAAGAVIVAVGGYRQIAPDRVMASGAAITRTDHTERGQWNPHGSILLRGRAEATRVSVPRRPNGDNGEHADH